MSRTRALRAPLRRLLVVVLLLCLLPASPPVRAAVGFDVITLPPNPELQALGGGLIDDNGTIYFLGQLSGVVGVYRLIADSVEPFLLDGAQVPAQLPSGIGTSITINRADPWFVDASGRVYFYVSEAGQSLITRALRLEVGGGFTLLELGPPGTRFHPETPTSSGRWLASVREQADPEDIATFYRTDGVSTQQLLRRPFRIFTCENGEQFGRVIDEAAIRVNAQGEGIVLEQLSTLRYPNPDCTGPRPQITSVGFRISGLNGATRVEEVLPTTEARLINPRLLHMNDAGQVLYVVLSVAPSGTVTYRLMRDSTTILTRSFVDGTAADLNDSFYSAQLQPDGSVVYKLAPGDDPARPAGGLFRDSALVLAGNDPLFPAPVNFVFLYRAGSRGALAASYLDPTLNRARFVLLSPALGRWVNGAGGAWADPPNWAGADVPGQGESALFNLANAYTVSTGAQQVGSVEVHDGDVTWTNGDLAIIGALRVGSRAGQGATNLSIRDGVQVGELFVGALPTSATDDETIATLQVLPDGQLDVSGPLVIGQAGRAGVGLFGGTLNAGETKLGVGGVGAFNTLVGGQWSSGGLLVGEAYPGFVNLGGGVSVQSSSVRIGGAPFSPNFDPGAPGSAIEPFSRVSIGGSGSDDAGNLTDPSSWSIAQDLELGSGHPGRLIITGGGSAQVGGSVLVDNIAGAATSGSRILVSGVEDETQTPATLLINQDILLGNADGAESELTVGAGGIVDVGRTLSVGHQPGSYAGVFITGAGATLTAGQATGASCTIGFSGGGELAVSAGGTFRCSAPLFVGLGDDDAYLTVTGAGSLARATRIEVGAPADADPQGTGTIQLNGGRITADQTLTIWENGTLTGNGTIQGTIINHGSFEPGLEPLASESGGLQTLAAFGAQPGTLTVAGGVTMAPDSTLKLDLVGPNQYDRLAISGATQLNGELVLAFSEGFAPRAGDSFAFVDADSGAGAFARVTVRGLEPGWQFTVSSSGGVTTLRSTTDGVAATVPTLGRVYLPLVRR